MISFLKCRRPLTPSHVHVHTNVIPDLQLAYEMGKHYFFRKSYVGSASATSRAPCVALRYKPSFIAKWESVSLARKALGSNLHADRGKF